jgi:hypothetical protein
MQNQHDVPSQHIQQAEFAVEYTTAERARLVVGGIVVGAAVVAIGKLWFFPWLTQFSAAAPCRSVLGINGVVALFYGLFVGIPLSCAFLIGSTLGLRGCRILRDRQVPPVGEKVFRATRIERGSKAKTVGWIHVLAFTPMVALAIWGSFQARKMTAMRHAGPPNCTAHVSAARTPSGANGRAQARRGSNANAFSISR